MLLDRLVKRYGQPRSELPNRELLVRHGNRDLLRPILTARAEELVGGIVAQVRDRRSDVETEPAGQFASISQADQETAAGEARRASRFGYESNVCTQAADRRDGFDQAGIDCHEAPVLWAKRGKSEPFLEDR